MPEPLNTATYVDAVQRLGPSGTKLVIHRLIGLLYGKAFPDREWVDEQLRKAYVETHEVLRRWEEMG